MEGIFEGKRALVVGGSKSVGSHVVDLLVDLGAEVYCASRAVPVNRNAVHVPVDFLHDDFSSAPFANLIKVAEKADLLFVCYGPFVQKPIEGTALDDWKNMALLDYALPGALVSSVLPHMKEKKWGRIVLFGGTRTESVKNFRSNTAYAGAKTGVSVIVKSVAAEFAGYGITCNCILPGFTHSAPKNTEAVAERTLAEHAVFAASHQELNGMLMNVDRGWVPE